MIVAKFGGTSVGTAQAIRRLLAIVKERVPEKPVVVVSAFAGVTDELLAAGRLAANGALKQALQKIAKLRARTIALADELLNPEARNKTLWGLEAQLAIVEELLTGTGALREFSPRTTDAVAACGELLSSRLIAAVLNGTGVPAEFIDARKCVVTDGSHIRALPLFALTERKLKEIVSPVLDRGSVVVMGGFIGATESGVTTTLGRGGSDFSAAIIGSCLGATRVEIWTDVNGIMTADPRICPDARTVPVISYEEAAQLANFGAKVVHPATLAPALEKSIPVHVLNSFNAEEQGTEIVPQSRESHRRITAIALKKDVSIFRVSMGRALKRQGFLQSVFNAVERCGCAAELVSSAEGSVSVAVVTGELAVKLERELAAIGAVQHESDKSIVCIVGRDLSESPDVLAKVLSALPDIPVAMVSQGPWRTNFAVVIDAAQASTAMRQVHSALFGKGKSACANVVGTIDAGGFLSPGIEDTAVGGLTGGSQA